ncbi:hypothetical protein LTR56_013553 [Elasticomyces elasticus]|nr:hypothetical protein LTR56_013553 [Elasticomyces elasticus]KAK3651017.1 hypothetical protein LTR22_012265 [Elasticomyces elasticus]KAK4931095.1 hypothetical protein LTR49_002511 [Elasticomyces elasticus]KAK5765563.1 hypothetical protein LTS12_004315 [Elasticomyces elasticus]
MNTKQTSAPTKVFATYELLEHILLRTFQWTAWRPTTPLVDREPVILARGRGGGPPNHRGTYARMPDDRRTALRALLVNQRVNKTFVAVVRTSPDLRVALFFDHEKHDRQGRFEYRPFANTLLESLDCYSPMENLHSAIAWNRSQDEFPNLLRVYRNGEKVREYEASGVEVVRAQTETSSWRKMVLLSQPVKVAITTIMPNGDDLEDVVLEDGATAEMLFGASFHVPVRCRWWVDVKNEETSVCQQKM